MYTCKVSSSIQNPGAVILHSSVDNSKANSLIEELKRRDIEVTAAVPESDLDAFLCRCRGRCIVYLSPQSVSDLCENSVVRSARERGCDTVVVVMDNTLETLPDEWIDFLCLRYDNQRLKELCRELALLIRTPLLPCRPKDITGYAAAFRVFKGYLRFAVPNFQERLKELYPDVYSSCVKKLLTICPESCCCPPEMEIEGSVEHAGRYILREIKRAGQQHRDFSASVYHIRDGERNRDYYCAVEFDNCLGSLNDIQKSKLVGIDETHMHRVRRSYMLYLKQLLKHSDRNYTAQHRILYWRDNDVRLDEFLLSVVREELEREREEVIESPIDFECVDGRGVNPGSLYAECYKLDSDPKGVCLIINIAQFESSTSTDNDVPQNLDPRTGSEADVCRLVDVFQKLKFEVKVHSSVKKSDFLHIINEVRNLDHRAYDAFVCCIMSHGCLGHIYTADNERVRILEDIARAFYPDNCPTLDGKPKIFFIQACQVNSMHSSVRGQGTADEGEFSATETTTYESDAEKCTALETTKRTLLVPDAPDFFMSYSTLPSSLSYRHLQNGTFYVQTLTEELKQGRELQDSLRIVAQRVEKSALGRQRPFHYVSTAHKSVFLCGKLFMVVLR